MGKAFAAVGGVFLVVILLAVMAMGAVMAAGDEPSSEGGGNAGGFDASKVPTPYREWITKAAQQCQHDELSAAVIAAQLRQESGFNRTAKSPAGAEGPAQFMPSTWPTWGRDDDGNGTVSPYDIADAVMAQGRMMCSLVTRAKDSPYTDRRGPVALALAGYNAGWGRVQQYKGVPPKSFAAGETYNYVVRILSLAKDYAAASAGTVVSPVNAPTSAPYKAAGAAWSSGYHTGVDFQVPTGTPVKSIAGGSVVSAGWGGSYGQEVVIKHRDGQYSQYAHLSRTAVKAGDPVKAGDRVGLSGNTGNSSGPHLHFEVRTGPGYGSDIDPVAYLRKHGVVL